jgi:adenylosuccinate synthase
VALRYAVMLSGVTKLIITKADVLDGFKEIKAATAYLADGQETKELPFDVCDADIAPVYETFSGWDKPVSTCTSYNELPQVFKDYCKYVEQYLETKVAYISNGTGRDQLLMIS